MKKKIYVYFTFIIAAVLLFFYNNCSRVNFQKLDSASNFTDLQEGFGFTDVHPQTKQIEGDTIDVIIFIDTSGSMTKILDSFNKGLVDLINNLSEKNLRVFIYDQKLNIFTQTLEIYQIDSAGNKVVIDPKTNLSGMGVYYSTVSNRFNYGYLFVPKSNVAITADTSVYQNIFEFSTALNSDLKLKTKQALQNKIKSMLASRVPYTSVKEYDVPLCSIYRIVDDIKNNQFYSKKSEKTVFMILSNEDDESYFVNKDTVFKDFQSGAAQNNCLKTMTSKREIKSVPIATRAYYSLLPKLTFETVTLDNDGVQSTYSNLSVMLSPILNTTVQAQGLLPESDCMSYPITETAVKNAICLNYKCGKEVSYKIKSCQFVKQIYLSQTQISMEDYLSSKSDFCTNMNNAYMLPNSCYLYSKTINSSSNFLGYTEMTSYLGDKKIDPLVTTNSQIVADFILTVPFSNSLSFINIINTDNQECPLTEGARMGLQYSKMARLLKSHSYVMPICTSNYSQHLLNITDQIKKTVVSGLVLPPSLIHSDRKYSVQLHQANGEVIPLQEGVDYEIQSDQMNIRKPLQVDDFIRFVYLD